VPSGEWWKVVSGKVQRVNPFNCLVLQLAYNFSRKFSAVHVNALKNIAVNTHTLRHSWGKIGMEGSLWNVRVRQQFVLIKSIIKQLQAFSGKGHTLKNKH